MKLKSKGLILLVLAIGLSSCVSKKSYNALQSELDLANKEIGKCGEDLSDYINRLDACNAEIQRLKTVETTLNLKEEQVEDLKDQISDLKSQRDRQLDQLGDLTVLSQSANENIKETLSQLEEKDKYVQLIQAARTKTDSLNLALAINLKSVLHNGVYDQDIDVKVDKTVVFVNLSDKMLYKSGSAKLTPQAEEVLGKIAKIIESRPNLEVMVEGNTDNIPIRNPYVKDNWDLSAQRATAVVRVLQDKYNIDPSRLIAAGRGEYLPIVSNDTADGRATNRRTRIIILPKLNEFYDLLNPELASGN